MGAAGGRAGRFRRHRPVSALLVACACLACGCDASSPTRPRFPDIGPGAVYPLHQYEPDWSRQGRLVYADAGIVCVRSNGAFSVDFDKRGLWIFDPGTGAHTRLPLDGVTPSWSPDGEWIAFSTPFSGAVFVVRANGDDLRQVTDAGSFYGPRWSPDGRSLVVFRSIGPEFGAWIVGVDGSGLRHLGAGNSGGDWHPLSMDTLLVVESTQAAFTLVAHCLSTGANVPLLTMASTIAPFPRYSPDARSIAFAVRPVGSRQGDLWLLRIGDAAARRLTHDAGTEPAWHPGSAELAYLREAWWSPAEDANILWRLPLAGGDRSPLTSRWPAACP